MAKYSPSKLDNIRSKKVDNVDLFMNADMRAAVYSIENDYVVKTTGGIEIEGCIKIGFRVKKGFMSYIIVDSNLKKEMQILKVNDVIEMTCKTELSFLGGSREGKKGNYFSIQKIYEWNLVGQLDAKYQKSESNVSRETISNVSSKVSKNLKSNRKILVG